MKMTRREWRQIAARAQQLAKRGKHVLAIKWLRYVTGCGIKDGRDAVIRLQALDNIQP